MWAINSAVGRFTPPSPLPLCLLLRWGGIFPPIPNYLASVPWPHTTGAKKGDARGLGGHCSPNIHRGMPGQTQASVCRHGRPCQRGLPWAATNTNSP